MRALEISRSGLLASIVVFLVAAVCIRLGVWQLDRRQQRLERNAAVAERLAQSPMTLRSMPRDTAGLTNRRATVTGVFDNDRAVVLAGRSHKGAPGVHVLSPLRLGDGAVLVNRGWLPSRDAATVDLSAVAVDTPVEVTGTLVAFPDVDVDVETDGFRTIWFRVEADAIRGQYPYPVAELYLVRAADAGSAAGLSSTPPPPGADPAGPTREATATAPVALPPATLDAGPHLSYALQWFSFALIAIVGWIALVIRRGGSSDQPVAGTSPRA